MFQHIPPVPDLIAIIVVIFFAIGIHEYAHCKFADMAGDPTPRYYGRVTLNLTKHFELMGTIMMLATALSGYGCGWGKPAPMDPRKMRNPRWDLFAAVAAGPISNLVQAVVYGIALRLILRLAPGALEGGGFLFVLLEEGIIINLSLCLFNLIPFGPLDGHWLVGQLLPDPYRHSWYKFNRQIGMIGLFVAIVALDMIHNNGGPDILGMIIFPPLRFAFRLITGIG